MLPSLRFSSAFIFKWTFRFIAIPFDSVLSLPLGSRNIEINVKIITAYGPVFFLSLPLSTGLESQCDCITEKAFQQGEHVSISKDTNEQDLYQILACRRGEKLIFMRYYTQNKMCHIQILSICKLFELECRRGIKFKSKFKLKNPVLLFMLLKTCIELPYPKG